MVSVLDILKAMAILSTVELCYLRIGNKMSRLKEKYKDLIAKELMKKFVYRTNMEVPKLLKITLNMGIGEAVNDKKVVENARRDLEVITGRRPIVTKSRLSIAGFKIREGYPVGVKVTLRRLVMYEFLDRLVTVALPRVRDFRGVPSKGFDGRGNFNFGIREQIIFPEVDYDKIDAIRGMNVTITTSAKTDEEAKALLDCFNFPFKN